MARTIRLRTIGAAGTGSPLPALGIIDAASEFGVTPSAGTATQMAGLQAALDSVATDARRRTRVCVPGDVTISEPLWGPDAGIAKLVGVHQDSASISYASGYSGDVIRLGIRRGNVTGRGMATSRFVNMNGIVEANAGQRYGITCGGGDGGHVAWQHSALNFGGGAWWGNVSSVTVDFMAYGLNGYGTLAGSHSGSRALPFYFASRSAAQGGDYAFLRVLDGNGTAWDARWSPNPIGLRPGVLTRITVQFSAAGTATLWIDRTRVSTKTMTYVSGPSASGYTGPLMACRSNPWKLMSGGLGALVGGTENFGTPDDLAHGIDGTVAGTACGYKVSKAKLYDETQATLTRIDAQAVTDLRQFYTFENGTYQTVALAPFDEPASSAATNRRVALIGSGVRHAGIFAEDWMASNGESPGRLAVSGLTLACRNDVGVPVALGNATFIRVEDCYLHGGMHAVAGWNVSSNYLNRFKNLQVQGKDAAFYAFLGIWKIEDCDLDNLGRGGIDAGISQVWAEGMTFPGFGNPEYFIRAWDQSSVTLSRSNIDFEGNTASLTAAFLLETGGSLGLTTDHSAKILLKEVSCSHFKNGVPPVIVRPLDRATVPSRPARVQIEDTVMLGSYPAMVGFASPLTSANGVVSISGVALEYIGPDAQTPAASTTNL